MNIRNASISALALGFVAVTATSQAFTVATFADPAVNGSTPLFTFDSGANTLDGGWTATGLTLLTPGWAAPDVTDAQFTMSTLALTPVVAGVYTTNGGTINFTDALSNAVMTITFGSGTFVANNGVGGSDFSGNNVTFSGPGISGWSGETFNFSFANPEFNGNIATYTASFTSSAVPEPATMVALASGVGLLMARRRRNK